MASALKVGQHLQVNIGSYYIFGKLYQGVWTAMYERPWFFPALDFNSSVARAK
jgi:hypothetical protein